MMRTADVARRRFELMAVEYLQRMGARIRERREELGLTQEDVARKMPGKITGQRISLWERGEHRPRDDSLEALARVLDRPISYFMAPEPEAGTADLMGALAGDKNDQLDRVEAKLDGLIKQLDDLGLVQAEALVRTLEDAARKAHSTPGTRGKEGGAGEKGRRAA